jgi:hypothetical protein
VRGRSAAFLTTAGSRIMPAVLPVSALRGCASDERKRARYNNKSLVDLNAVKFAVHLKKIFFFSNAEKKFSQFKTFNEKFQS